MTDRDVLAQIESEIERIQNLYAEECLALTKEKGFDEYSPKWQKRIKKLADKYADLLYPLKLEHDDLRITINLKEEEDRKKKYKDVRI